MCLSTLSADLYSNPGIDCGFVPLFVMKGLKVEIFNERYYTNSWVTIQNDIRISVGSNMSDPVIFLEFNADADAFPSAGLLGSGNFQSVLKKSSGFDATLSIPSMGVDIRVWRLVNSINNYLNIQIDVPSGPELLEATGICIEVRACVLACNEFDRWPSSSLTADFNMYYNISILLSFIHSFATDRDAQPAREE